MNQLEKGGGSADQPRLTGTSARMSLLFTSATGHIRRKILPNWQRRHLSPILTTTTSIGSPNADNIENLQILDVDHRHFIEQGKFGNSAMKANPLTQHQPHAIIFFAAESPADPSYGPNYFVRTNPIGNFRMLDAAHAYWRGIQSDARHASKQWNGKQNGGY